jgi:cation diffusion facilitator CzcD-associated flavoprotein CzcO
MTASSNAHQDPSRWCVIGAGPSGLTTLKSLRALGVEAECLEREDDLGGNWYFGSPASRIFASTRLISSKPLTEYVDYPMPRELPWHPHHTACLDYLRSYANHFGLRPFIHSHCDVERVEPVGRCGKGWLVHLRNQRPRRYAGVVIANGHNHVPRMPTIPGVFSGTLMHSADYKSPQSPLSVKNLRVVVIGGGNSGCDIAVDVCQHAQATFHATRRSYHVVPRTILGRPADLRSERLLNMRVPTWLRRLISLRLIDRSIGLPERHGLPTPDHRLWETHPVINERLYGCIDAGQITPVGGVERFAGRDVIFANGRCEQVDLVIAATGYRIAMPFIAPSDLDGRPTTKQPQDHDEAPPDLFLHMLPRHRLDLACVGLIQPDSGQWGLTDLQGRVVARMALAGRHAPRTAAWLRRQSQRSPSLTPIRYVDSPRHRLEVEHHSYRRRLERLIQALDRRLRRELNGAVAGAADCRRAPRAHG